MYLQSSANSVDRYQLLLGLLHSTTDRGVEPELPQMIVYDEKGSPVS